MEALGLALSIAGAVGTIAQLLDGCIKGYQMFTTAKGLGRDTEKLACKIRIEETRLKVWGRAWGVAEGRFEASFDEDSPAGTNVGLKGVAELILKELCRTVNDLGRLQERYGIRREGLEEEDGEKIGNGNGEKNSEKNGVHGNGSANGKKKKVGGWAKVRWVVGDKEKFGEFLNGEFWSTRLLSCSTGLIFA